MRVSYFESLNVRPTAKAWLAIDYTKVNPAKTIPHDSVDVMIDSIGATFSSVLDPPQRCYRLSLTNPPLASSSQKEWHHNRMFRGSAIRFQRQKHQHRSPIRHRENS
jgi:hypothetical protein